MAKKKNNSSKGKVGGVGETFGKKNIVEGNRSARDRHRGTTETNTDQRDPVHIS
eukprot:CAMPEP_0195537622 /NCGR_PEP_ID=MMETSP0794_2-20130614/48268_1 /TAXON_ID=515487 /ORGANISM="Stephanopyxis turris, Strain CCMP 815" /LENGTH=53 /DNA_ID=CAMNT_0040671377 /DNA_START=8 /DNA_END=165 /DNA_ORIENTATION=-